MVANISWNSNNRSRQIQSHLGNPLILTCPLHEERLEGSYRVSLFLMFYIRIDFKIYLQTGLHQFMWLCLFFVFSLDMSAGTKVLGLVNETMSSLSSIKIKVSELRLFLMVLVLSAPRRMDKSVSALKWSDKLDSVLRCIHPNGWILTWQRGGAFQSSLKRQLRAKHCVETRRFKKFPLNGTFTQRKSARGSARRWKVWPVYSPIRLIKLRSWETR